jgi:hypothetical protein
VFDTVEGDRAGGPSRLAVAVLVVDEATVLHLAVVRLLVGRRRRLPGDVEREAGAGVVEDQADGLHRLDELDPQRPDHGVALGPPPPAEAHGALPPVDAETGRRADEVEVGVHPHRDEQVGPELGAVDAEEVAVAPARGRLRHLAEGVRVLVHGKFVVLRQHPDPPCAVTSRYYHLIRVGGRGS